MTPRLQLIAVAATCVALTLAGFTAGWAVNGWRLGAQVQKCRADSARTLGEINARAADAERDYRAKETEWATKLAGVTQDGQTKLDAARRDAVAAGVERDGLRRELDRYRAAARAAADTGAAAAGTPAADAVDLLAELLSRADERAGELAHIADLSHAAGSTCERAYDALLNLEDK